MLLSKLVKVNGYGWHCHNSKCDHLEKYHEQILSAYQLKIGTISLWIGFNDIFDKTNWHVYCEDCIDKIYKELKPILDKKLWVFK